jgi:predicted exporter
VKRQQADNALVNSALSQGKYALIQSILAQANWQFSQELPTLLPDYWLKTHLGKMHQQQWLDQGKLLYSVVRLSGIFDAKALRNLAEKITVLNQSKQKQEQSSYVYFIDQAGDISAQLGQFNQQLIFVLIAAIFAALLVFVWRYGVKVAALAIVTPVFALVMALLLSFLVQQSLSIFNLVAGILILALGLDYSVFYAEHGLKRKVSLTTLMSALSSIFVFAILVLSSMPAITHFGLTVFIGVLITFIFAPIVTLAKTSGFNR